MAFSRSFAEMETDARARADVVNSTFPPSTEVQEWLNKGYARFYSICVDAGEKHFLVQPAPIFNTANGVVAYPLPADHFQTLAVDVFTGGEWVAAHRFQFERRNDFPDGSTGWSDGRGIMFDLWGSNLAFVPTPTGVTQYRLWYFPKPVRLTNGASFFDGPESGVEYVTDFAAKRIAEKDDNYELAQSIYGSMVEQEPQIVMHVKSRIVGEAKKVREVRGLPHVPGMRPMFRMVR